MINPPIIVDARGGILIFRVFNPGQVLFRFALSDRIVGDDGRARIE